MKTLAIVSAALLVSSAAFFPTPPSTCATHPATCMGTVNVDEPPPERDDCPLCGGNPALHVKRVFALAEIGAWSTANAVPR